MKQFYILFSLIILCFTNISFGQSAWTSYNTVVTETNLIKVDAQNVKWISDYSGLYSLNGSNWTYYGNYNNNSQIKIGVNSIAIDKQDNKWFAAEGVVKFDGINWTKYNKSNSGLVSNSVSTIVIDSKGVTS